MDDNRVGCGFLLIALALGVVAWFMGLGNYFWASVATGHGLDWAMGGVCLLWLLVILKVPWDLYFQAHQVAFEIHRSQERRIPLPPGRMEYIGKLRPRLLWFAIGAHLFSAGLIAGIAYFAGSAVGYYFSAFYLVSTAFRPAAAGYVYLTRKLRAIEEEARYPREDITTLKATLERQEIEVKALQEKGEAWERRLEAERQERLQEEADQRQKLHALSREFETTVSRLTDNQEVIKGIQAFVRLISQAGISA